MATKQPAQLAAQNAGGTSETKVVTSKVRFSYVHVFQPTAMTNEAGQVTGVPKYSVSIIISKDDKELLDRINKAINVAVNNGVTAKFGGKKPANLKLPLRDGDVERPENPEYTNSYFLNATSNTKPGILDRKKNPILDETEFYSGVYGRASINFYPFNSAGNKGVACGLNHVQKLEDGEPLGGRGRAEDDFDDLEDDDDIMG